MPETVEEATVRIFQERYADEVRAIGQRVGAYAAVTASRQRMSEARREAEEVTGFVWTGGEGGPTPATS
jgi:hypothetical protein